MAFHRLLDLPLELRNNIYDQVISDGIHIKTKGFSSCITEARYHPTPNHGFNIAFANRQISAEFLQHAYLYGVFKLPLTKLWTSSFATWKISKAVLEKIQNMRFVRDLNLETRDFAYEAVKEIDLDLLYPHCPSWERVESETIIRPDMIDPEDLKILAITAPGSSEKALQSNLWNVPRDMWDQSYRM